jgi:hypothetical protein
LLKTNVKKNKKKQFQQNTGRTLPHPDSEAPWCECTKGKWRTPEKKRKTNQKVVPKCTNIENLPEARPERLLKY